MDASRKVSKLKKLSEAEKGYVAGIMDGEGHFYMTGPSQGIAYSRVRVRVTDQCIIKYLKQITGIGSVYEQRPSQRRKDGEEKRLVYEWTVIKRADVRELLQTIHPYLILKKKNAGLLLELESLKDQGAANGIDCERIKTAIARRVNH